MCDQIWNDHSACNEIIVMFLGFLRCITANEWCENLFVFIFSGEVLA